MTTAKFIEIRENKEEIVKIAEATAQYLEADRNMVIDNPMAIATIAYAFVRQSIEFVNRNKAEGEDISLNLLQLLDIGVTYRENEDAEKEGNFTPFVSPGQEFKLLVKNDDETEEE